MKYRMAIAAIAALLTSNASALDRTQLNALIECLIRVESGGKSDAVGDNGKAYGILQIHAGMVADANRIARTHFKHEDMFNPRASREVADIILSHYNSHIKTTTGREATAKELAFVWNGGGSAWRRAENPVNDSKQTALERYWSKVARR